jgi:hypothetical protein
MRAGTWLRHTSRAWRLQERGQAIALAAGAVEAAPGFVE